MVGPVGQARALAGQRGQLAGHEVAEALPGGVDVPAVAEHEVHRHVEHVVDIAFVAEARVEHERQHAGAVRIGVRPDVAAVRKEAVGLALGERRIGEQRRRQRLQRQADAELLRHVRFRPIVEVGLDRAGAQHHVEAHAADARHVPQHDVVAALGHDRQRFARLVGPHAEAEEALAGLGADLLDLAQVPSGLGASLVQVLQRRAGQLELAGGLQADGAVGAGHRDDVPAFLDRRPAELAQGQQQVADAARLLVGRGVEIGGAIDELLVLGADPPGVARLLARGHRFGELPDVLDQRIVAI